MPTIGGYSYTELDKTVGQSGIDDFDLSPDSRQLAHSKAILCAWSDRYNIVNTLYNTNSLCPVSALYALLFHIEPCGKPSAENTWPKAKVTIGYKNLPYDPTVLKEEIYESAIYIPKTPLNKPDGSATWTFDNDSTDLTGDPTVYFSMIAYTVTLHAQSSFDRTTADGLLNKVNNGSFNSWSAGHVLFEGYNSTKKTNVSGAVTYENVYKFKWAPVDHRREFNPTTGTYELCKSGGNYKYDSGDFSTLDL